MLSLVDGHNFYISRIRNQARKQVFLFAVVMGVDTGDQRSCVKEQIGDIICGLDVGRLKIDAIHAADNEIMDVAHICGHVHGEMGFLWRQSK